MFTCPHVAEVVENKVIAAEKTSTAMRLQMM